MNMTKSFGNDNKGSSYEDKAREFRNYWLDPNYSYLRSDSKDFFNSNFDFRV